MSKSILARNLFRTGVIEKLSRDNSLKIVVLVPNIKNVDFSNYADELDELKKERPSVEIIAVPDKRFGFLERVLYGFMSNLTFSKTTRLTIFINGRTGEIKNPLVFVLYWLIYAPLSRLNFFKKLCRAAYCKLFRNDVYGRYFDKYKPDLVFSTSIVTIFDIDILREAKRRRVKTVSMPKSWDNIDKILYFVEPDLFLVQNELMKTAAMKYQCLSPQKIKVVGFPQFDIYAGKKSFSSREEYCRSKNFNPKLPIIFLGSGGPFTKGDKEVFKGIIEMRNRGEIPDCNISISTHFLKAGRNEYEDFKKERNVFIEDLKSSPNSIFIDGRCASNERIKSFVDFIFHSAAIVTFASTLALDAACLNKPAIAINYGVRFVDGKDKTSSLLYKTVHYEWVLSTDAVSLANSPEHLAELINLCLKNPSYKNKERGELVDKLCYKVDGLSSHRIAQEILSCLSH
ncbi:MAG: hypothetical protein ABIH57_00390 [Candidatus Omnitrophota bacterium]